ncbi:hypothetical protein E2C01_033251 [Portunus trituberculatus]|uniref:Uncharacterized protein n=1 Tax=Portunus trituberculatus TaxID=210409 RepID=A0A5B7F2Y9_PORTR|nr:hypothetical protein [Portunus trituberculatus]
MNDFLVTVFQMHHHHTNNHPEQQLKLRNVLRIKVSPILYVAYELEDVRKVGNSLNMVVEIFKNTIHSTKN